MITRAEAVATIRLRWFVWRFWRAHWAAHWWERTQTAEYRTRGYRQTKTGWVKQ